MTLRCRFCGKRAEPYFGSRMDRYVVWSDLCTRCAVAYERGVSDTDREYERKDLKARIDCLEKTNKALEALINKFVKDEKVEE